MSNKIGRFEILSEISHSEVSSVYKASDTESSQTVALKAIHLEPLGEQAPALVKSVLEEAETSKLLNSHNIALLYGAGEMEGKLCASMEYVQGNSVATMLARKEGFSIWDLQDIARQTCQGFDHAHTKKVLHYSLEPAKIMVQWDGIVKILGFGVSGTSSYAVQATGKAPDILHYMSPEQLQGEPVDARSNLFSLGAILYEMVTERKAFEGDDADQVRQSILEMTPVAVDQINRKIHPGLSAVIMKALSKAPQERYQSGQEFVVDLEKCKEGASKASVGVKPAASVAPKVEPKIPSSTAATADKPAQANHLPKTTPATASKAAAAGAGWGRATGSSTPNAPGAAYQDPASGFVTSCVKATVDAISGETASMSAATEEPPVRTSKITVDPMMDESRQPGAKGPSFSEISELPPLKEVYVEPEPAPAAEPEPMDAVKSAAKAAVFRTAAPPKPKTPPSEVARKAVAEIKKTPPQLFIYSIAGAAIVILLVVAGITYHLRSEDADEDNTPTTLPVATSDASASSPAQPNPAQASAPTTAPATAQVTPEPPVDTPPAVTVTPKFDNQARGKKKAKGAPSVAAQVAGRLNIDSNPQGAQIQVDGRSAGVTPFDVAGLSPGQHSITLAKSGYASETRSVEVSSGSRSMISIQLALLAATVSANSEPAGAEVWMDGKNSGHLTPAQISVDKPGSHTFIFKKAGYLEETTSANLQIGQTLHLAPTLRALGNTNEIRIGGGKFKKMFGGADTAGMGTVSVKTQPKGAQIAVNNRMVDKMSPVDFYLNPGNYVIDITMSGFKNVHKVVTVDKNGKVVIDENLDRE